MVNYVLENFVVHSGKDDKLEKGVDSSEKFIGVWSYLKDLNVADTLLFFVGGTAHFLRCSFGLTIFLLSTLFFLVDLFANDDKVRFVILKLLYGV